MQAETLILYTAFLLILVRIYKHFLLTKKDQNHKGYEFSRTDFPSLHI